MEIRKHQSPTPSQQTTTQLILQPGNPHCPDRLTIEAVNRSPPIDHHPTVDLVLVSLVRYEQLAGPPARIPREPDCHGLTLAVQADTASQSQTAGPPMKERHAVGRCMYLEQAPKTGAADPSTDRILSLD